MENNKKISFFRRLKIAIFNLDEYGIFIGERFSVAVKYILKLIIITSIIFSFVITIDVLREFKKGMEYLENEFPDFSFNETNLKIDEYVYGYDEEYNVKIIADTSDELNKDKLTDYKKNTKDADTSIIVLSDRIIYRKSDYETEYTYKYLNNVFNLNNSTKRDILQEYNEMGGINALFVSSLISFTIVNIFEAILETAVYVILVSIIGLIVGRFCGIAMRSTVSETLAIYSLTVPTICKFIYSIINNYNGFEIKNFNMMYLIIAYIYMIAAILIIKTDLIKQTEELMRIKSAEEEVRDELKKRELEKKEQEEKEKNDSEEDKKEKKKDSSEPELKDTNTEPELKDTNTEPDGSGI